MSPAPQTANERADGAVSKYNQMLNQCLSCRIISGSGLLLSGLYVYSASRKWMNQGRNITAGIVAQISFATCLAVWGVVTITEPFGKTQRKP